MPAALPQPHAITAPAGAQWVESYQLLDDNGALAAITGKTFQFAIRPSTADTTQPAMVAVNSTAANGQGYITVTVATSTLQVVLSPSATLLLGAGARPYALWMDNGQPDAEVWLDGIFTTYLVAAA